MEQFLKIRVSINPEISSEKKQFEPTYKDTQLSELAKQYRYSAAVVYNRIRDIATMLTDENASDVELAELRYRHKTLLSIYNDTLSVARHLETYIKHGV